VRRLLQVFRNRWARTVGLILAAASVYFFAVFVATYGTVDSTDSRCQISLESCLSSHLCDRWLRGYQDSYSFHLPPLQETVSVFVNVFLLNAIPLFGSLLVFRAAGYRVTFRREGVAQPQAQPPNA
jgi:hypothetical protein